MKVGFRGAAAAALLAIAAAATAAPDAVVDAVQSPAWIERGGERQALAPGMMLQNRDRLVTGPGARAVVQLADGTAVKLGENARVGLNALGRREGGVFTAAVDVAAGAFRLTTNIFRKLSSRRAINVRAGTVTAGIRGTDIWGRSSAERDFVCLLEGRIAVSHPLGQATELTEPLQFYGADKGQAPGPVASADRAEVARWAFETELQEGAATRRRGGQWRVRLAGGEDQAAALALYDQAQAAGQAVRLRPQRSEGGQYRYNLEIRNIASREEALQLGNRLARDLGIAAPVAVYR